MERAYAFMREFDSPVHRPVRSGARRLAGKDEVCIDGAWSLSVEDNAAAEVRTAAADLADFLKVGFGIELSGAESSPSIHITAGRDRSVPPCAADEGYRVTVEPDGIRIHGSGPRGALYGAIKLEQRLKARGAPCARLGTLRQTPRFAPRILRSYSSPYYTETIDGEKHYSDHYLSRLAHLGYDAVWLRGELRDLSRTDVFPKLGRNSDRNLDILKDLIERACRWGIGVYLYLCEPHGLPVNDSFWKKHPDARGAEGPEMGKDVRLNALCTSVPEVKRFLREASCDMFTRAPGLEGLLLITASEHTAHCKQRRIMEKACPRCANRHPSEIVSEIVELIRQGARDAGSPARLVAWNWAWDGALGEDAEPRIVAQMPDDVCWMANVENGGAIERFGQKAKIWEYSLCYPGPSPLFRRKARKAKDCGHAVWGKAQINVTHEFCSMPYMPVPFLLRDKFRGLARAGVEGLMCCWIFGGYPGVGSEQANAMMWQPLGDAKRTLLDSAAALYGEKTAPAVVEAWELFSRGYACYPFDGVYVQMLNAAPAHPFYFRPVRRPERANWRRQIDPFGDILTWCRAFTPETAVQCFEALLGDWDAGVRLLKQAFRRTPQHLRNEARRDLNVCEAIGVHFRSALHFTRFIRLRDRLPDLGGPTEWPEGCERFAMPIVESPAEIRSILNEIERILQREARLVAAYVPLVESDSRLGYHSEGDYRFRPKDLRKKLSQARNVLESQIPTYRRRVLQSR